MQLLLDEPKNGPHKNLELFFRKIDRNFDVLLVGEQKRFRAIKVPKQL